MTIHDWLRINQKELPEGESILLLSFVLKKEKAYILAHPECTLSREEGVLLERCAERRKKHEPIAYITGEKEFFGFPFFVTEATLIPRPETEILVEYALETIADCRLQIAEKEKTISLIDIGTGSGCIPISIMRTLREKNSEIFSHVQCIAADISHDAIAIARKNAVHHDMDRFIRFQESNLTTDIPESYFRTPFLILT
ncbi:MAG: peptide chain release factor N(5)-glutamine methyltransferase, partial [Candidatus Moranbacteria bacterium]|nr:peptide chain release factor N(5)-glutamine methyltransferase [Candidatus Moranbacteria bacterium]